MATIAASTENEMAHHESAAHGCCPDAAEDVSEDSNSDCHATDAPDAALAGTSTQLQIFIADAVSQAAILPELTLGGAPLPTVARAPPDLLAETALYLQYKKTVVLRA